MLRTERHSYIRAERRVRFSRQQIDMIIDYMAANPEFGRGETLAIERKEKWEELLSMIMKEGQMKLSLDKLRVTWRDLKKNARNELARVRHTASNGGNSKLCKKSHRILVILQILKPTSVEKISNATNSEGGTSDQNEENSDTEADLGSNVGVKGNKTKLVDSFQKLAEDKRELVRLKKRLVERQWVQQTELHKLQMKAVEERMMFERRRNMIEIRHMKDKHEFEMSLIKKERVL